MPDKDIFEPFGAAHYRANAHAIARALLQLPVGYTALCHPDTFNLSVADENGDYVGYIDVRASGVEIHVDSTENSVEEPTEIGPEPSETWINLKRGTEYLVMDVEIPNQTNGYEGQRMVYYISKLDGSRHVRELLEFRRKFRRK